MSKINIGLDVGNFDTKTSERTKTASGFSSYSKKPFAIDECLKVNDIFYVPESDRFPYTKDKTEYENLFILSLLGISKEILSRATSVDQKKRAAAKTNPELAKEIIGIQGEISKFDQVRLGVGLPPTHCATLSDKTKQYYYDHMENGVDFEYGKYHFSYRLTKCECYPQDYATIITYNPRDSKSIINNYESFYALDIGGMTCDIISIMDGRPSLQKSDSVPNGVLAMYSTIVQQIEIEEGHRLSKQQIESILLNKPTIVDQKIVNAVIEKAREWYHQIIASFVQFGCNFQDYPVIFMGGGSLLFKQFIEERYIINVYEIIDDPFSNAIAYKRLISKEK